MEDTRTRILAATNELFRSQGFNGTSLKQVSQRADAPTGSVYHHFPGGKEELGAAALRDSGLAYQALFELIADEAADIAVGVGAFFEGAAQVLEETNFVDICPIGTVSREVASTHDLVREASVAVFAGWTAALAERLEAAGTDPNDAERLADTIISALEGGFILARARRCCGALRATGTHMQEMVEQLKGCNTPTQ